MLLYNATRVIYKAKAATVNIKSVFPYSTCFWLLSTSGEHFSNVKLANILWVLSLGYAAKSKCWIQPEQLWLKSLLDKNNTVFVVKAVLVHCEVLVQLKRRSWHFEWKPIYLRDVVLPQFIETAPEPVKDGVVPF